MKIQKRYLIALVSLALILSVIFTVFSFIHEIKRDKLPVLGQVEGFQLINSEGHTFNSNVLKGQVWIADFIFTTCAGVCPIMSKNMASLHRSYKREPSVSLVSVSVNPEVDSPQVLSEYAKRYDADTGKWHFLTGSREAIRKLAIESFKLGSIEEPIFHSTYFTLVDRNGLIRGYYDGTKTDEINKLFKESAALIREK